MLSSIVSFALRYRGVVIGLTCVLVAYGTFRLSSAGLDIFPEFSPKRVIIQTEAPGLSAKQVEILVTQRVENAISGLQGLKNTRSESIQGLSIVTAVLAEKTDVYKNRVRVSERISALAENLPQGTRPPVMVPLSSLSATVLTIGIQSRTLDLMKLRSLAERSIIPRLLSTPGVADINVFGGQIRQLQIQLAPDKLRFFGMGINEIHRALEDVSGLRGTGFIENKNQRFALEISGQPTSAEQIGNILLPR